MSSILSNGTWKGEYTYGEDYDEDIQGLTSSFYIHITIDNDIISGTCTGDPYPDAFHEPVTIEGFIEDHFVSFVKTYPCQWHIEGNEIVIIPELPPYEVHYIGNYDNGTVSGTWEIITPYKDDKGDDYEDVLTGTWNLQKAHENLL